MNHIELRAALAEDEEIQQAAKESLWRCFHCGFETSDHKEGAAHFGDRDDESPICITWASLSVEERLGEYQALTRELNGERDENARLRSREEYLEFRLLEFENLLGSRFKGCRTINDAYNLYDSMEGRALAAEEREAERTRQLREALNEIERLKAAGKVLAEIGDVADECVVRIEEFRQARKVFEDESDASE